MPQVKLMRALLVGGVFYQPGVQEISEGALKHPDFEKFAKWGVLCDPHSTEMEKIETPVERAKRLHEQQQALEAKKLELQKAAEQAAVEVAPPQAPEAEKAEEPKVDAPAEAAKDEGKKKSKKG